MAKLVRFVAEAVVSKLVLLAGLVIGWSRRGGRRVLGQLDRSRPHPERNSEQERDVGDPVPAAVAVYDADGTVLGYRRLVESLPLVVYINALDDVSSTIYISPQTELLLGYTVEEWLTQPDLFARVVHEDDRERVLAEIARVEATGESFSCEYRMIARDGRVVWFYDEAVPLHTTDGEPRYARGYMIDISARRRAEEELQRGRMILEAIARVSEILLSATSWQQVAEDVLRLLGEGAGASRAYLFENRRAEDGRTLSDQRFEWASADVESFRDDPVLQGFDLGAKHRRFSELLASGGIVADLTRNLLDEERIELEREGIRSLLLAPIMAEGRWWGWLGIDDCLTERVWSEGEIDAMRAAAGTIGAAIRREHAEATEREAVQRLQAVIDASPAGIVGLDRSGCVVIWNAAAEVLFGWRAAEVLGRPNPIVPAGGREQFQSLLARGVSGGTWNDVELVRRRKDGGEVHVSSSAAPLQDGDGNIVGAVAVLVDIDERKAAERERERLLAAERGARAEAETAREQLIAQNEQLRQLDRLKDEFVALVSHELRTPLTSVLGYLDLVLDAPEATFSEEQQRLLAVVQRNSQRLLGLVGDLLFLAQADAGKPSLERGPVDLTTLARECVEAALPHALGKGIELHCYADPPVADFEGDRVRLAQLFDNLISNAIKFTPEGGAVEVRVAEGGGGVVLSVSDTGIGVSEDEQQRLFERFFRTTGATRSAIQGSGLGLAITKTIAEAHGGRVTFASEEGVGTTFWVEFPTPLAAAA